MTRSLETVIASATLSTTTMPVAADRPPSMVVSARRCAPALSGSASTVRSRSIAPSGKRQQAGDRQRHDEQVDQDEIERETARPRGRCRARPRLSTTLTWNWRGSSKIASAESSVVVDPVGGIGRRAHHRGDARLGRPGAEQLAQAAEQPPDDEGADGEEGDELDHRLDRDRQDQSVLMLGRIDPPRAERHGEGGEQEGDGEVESGGRRAGRQPSVLERIDHHQHRLGDRLELQRDVGRGGGQRDQRRERRRRLRLAVAGGDEVGDGGEVLRARQIADAADQAMAEPDDQDRPDVDRQEIEALRGGEADRAVIGPGRAVDRQAQRIDQRAVPADDEAPPAVIAPPGDGEQEADIAERGEKDGRAVQHGGGASVRSMGLLYPPAGLALRGEDSRRSTTALGRLSEWVAIPPRRARGLAFERATRTWR